MLSLTIDQQEYEALVSLARSGVSSAEGLRNLDAFLKKIERENGITRYGLWIQWQEAGKQIPLNVTFPDTWPPELRHYVELISRPISKADVKAVLAKKAKKPLNVLVTPDPAGVVGWTELDTYFAT